MSASELPHLPVKIDYDYDFWAQDYLENLTLKHHMEATPQATQRKITLESLDLVVARRRDVHVFNELLVQYPREGKQKPGQVVPDNMVVLHEGAINAIGHYAIAHQPARPFWVMEYVSKSSVRKDYEDNFERYQNDLKVPYYLVYYPDNEEMTLYLLAGSRYQAIRPDNQGLYVIPELEMSVGLHEGWVRFWYQGELLPLPADLQRSLDDLRKELQQTQEQLEQTKGQLTKTKGQLTQTAEQLTQTAEQLTQTAEQLTETEEQLTETKEQLTETKGQLTQTKGQLTQTAGQLTETKEQLTETKEQLTETKEQLTETKEQLTETQSQLALMQQQLDLERQQRDAMERELALLRARLKGEMPPSGSA